jgi:hypothetical protein
VNLAAITVIAATAIGCGDSAATAGGLAGTGSDSSDAAVAATAAQLLDLTAEATSYAVSNAHAGAPIAVAGVLPFFDGQRRGTDWINIRDIDFRDPSDINRLIDLDATDEDGNDLFPDASGQIRLTATVASSNHVPRAEGQPATGFVSLSPVQVTAVTEITVSDRRNGNTASWPATTSHSGTWRVDYERSDRNNWSMAMAGTRSVTNKTVTITTDDGNQRTGVINARWQSNRSRARVNGERAPAERSLSGSREVVWTGADGNQRTVSWNVVSLDEIYVTINGETTGPFTIEELRKRGQAPSRDR